MTLSQGVVTLPSKWSRQQEVGTWIWGNTSLLGPLVIVLALCLLWSVTFQVIGYQFSGRGYLCEGWGGVGWVEEGKVSSYWCWSWSLVTGNRYFPMIRLFNQAFPLCFLTVFSVLFFPPRHTHVQLRAKHTLGTDPLRYNGPEPLLLEIHVCTHSLLENKIGGPER